MGLFRLLAAFLGLLAESGCFVIGHGRQIMHENQIRPLPKFKSGHHGLKQGQYQRPYFGRRSFVGRSISSYVGMWVLFHHDSSAAPQTTQTASPVCGSKNFSSVRLYSAPQLH
jgi:hypothetical protein